LRCAGHECRDTNSRAMALIVILLLVEIWLVTATLETYLAGYYETVLPGAIISGVIFLACFGLYLFIERMDAEVREP
jgi:hypothetical protein